MQHTQKKKNENGTKPKDLSFSVLSCSLAPLAYVALGYAEQLSAVSTGEIILLLHNVYLD